MKMNLKPLFPKSLLCLLLLLPGSLAAEALPQGFVYIKDIVPDVIISLRYYTSHNFVGRPIDGYEQSVGIISEPAALALKQVQAELKSFGLGLKVFDAYRPQTAVNHFVRWAEDLDDTVNKQAYYPDVDKKDLFAKGYIAARSGHSRGSTVDLTIISLNDGRELPMGTPWDFFGPHSWPSYMDISAEERANRLLLRSLMLKHGFKPLKEEWWHFTLENEPFPETYFDFPVR